MFYNQFQIVLQEVPGEISLCFSVSGCVLRCEGCHSPHLFKEGVGKKLTKEVFLYYLLQYQNYATCVLFFGGEWHEEELISFLELSKQQGYKTCLYTGLDSVNDRVIANLDFLKSGAWIAKNGGLSSVNTNQKFINVKTKQVLNHLFIK